MNRSAPFARARAMMAAIAAIYAQFQGGVLRDIALRGVAPYESHGKGGKRAHRPTGIAGVRRAALKSLNRQRNRRAHRG